VQGQALPACLVKFRRVCYIFPAGEGKALKKFMEEDGLDRLADGKKEDDEISLIDLFAVLLRRKVMIILITAAGAVFSVVFSVVSLVLPSETSFLPNVYTPRASLLISGGQESGGLSSLLSSNSSLSSLASLAGISAGGGGGDYKSLAIFLTTTDSLRDAVIDNFNLMKKHKDEKFPRTASRKDVEKALKAELDDESGVLIVDYTHRDPELARDIVNFVVTYIEERFKTLSLDSSRLEKENLEKDIANTYQEIKNLELQARGINDIGRGVMPPRGTSIGLETSRIQLELEAQKAIYVQLKSQYELVKIAMESKTPVFQVLELPEVPERKSGPGRGLLCIIVTFAAGFLAVFLAFILNAAENIKKDPEAMAKLRGRA